MANSQGIKNLYSGSTAYSTRQIMIAYKEENRNSHLGQPPHPPGELSLLSLRRVTVLVGITAEKDHVHLIAYGIFHHLVQSSEDVKQPRRQPRGWIDTAVGLHT